MEYKENKLGKKKITRTYNAAFIDGENFYKGITTQGYSIDYRKFRIYLKNKYNVERAYIFIGFVAKNQHIYTKLQEQGYICIFKPTISYSRNGVQTQKGNVDAELVLHAAKIEYDNYQKAVIVSSDGDFACLHKYLISQQKLVKILAPSEKYSKLLREYSDYIVIMTKVKIAGIEENKPNKKARTSVRSKP